DGLLSLGKLDVELALDRLAARFGFCIELVARLIGDRLSASTCVGNRFLVVCERRLRLVLKPLRFREVAFDALGPIIDDPADARYRDARDQEVEHDECDREPDKLRGKRILLE